MDHIVVVYDDATVSAPELRIRQGDSVEGRGPSGATINFRPRGCPLNGGPRFTVPQGGSTGRLAVLPAAAEASFKYDTRVGSKGVDPRIDIIP